MRISDWSSDVCSSDLAVAGVGRQRAAAAHRGQAFAAPAADAGRQGRRRRAQGCAAARPAQRCAGQPGTGEASTGWNAPAMSPWLEKAIDAASQEFYGRPAMYMGEGGSIPFMGMLDEKFPGAQFMITGVLGPHSNEIGRAHV